MLARRFAFLGLALITTVLSLSALDKVRVETRVDDAVAMFGVSGRGVIFAMLDRGIDWQTNDFRNADGTTRIAYIFDLTDDTGAHASNNPYGMGTVYTQSQINQALRGGPPLATRDAIGHGTANTAIAAGNGRNSNGKYRGIAPFATIIAVKLVSDGAPAHDNQPAESAFYEAGRISIAYKFVRDKAQELGMPCVMVLDIGSQGGPTDGTSSMAREIDSIVGGTPGLVIVTGAGDDGGQPNRSGGSVPPGGHVDIRIQKGVPGALLFDLWYAGTDRFDISIQTPDAVYGPFVAPSNTVLDSRTDLAEISYYHYGSSFNGWGSTNGKRELFVSLNGPVGVYTITLSGATVVNGHFDATLNPSQEWNTSISNIFLDSVVPGSISDLSSARNAIVDACYVVRTTWTDIDGFTRTQSGQGNVGDLWIGTSVGPTFDGRFGIDVGAPANNIITAYAPNSYWATVRGNLISDGNGLYGIGGANSSSNPVVAGIIALMLEVNPRLDAVTVKSILQRTARMDSFTGTVPNPRWGFGKIDALAAITIVKSWLAGGTTFDPSNIGVYRSSGNAGVFALDLDKATYNYTGTATKMAAFGLAGDQPVAGDWLGTGVVSIGVFRGGAWYFDLNNNGQFDAGEGPFFFGLPGDTAVVGDWTGSGMTKVGVFRCPAAGVCSWYLSSANQTAATLVPNANLYSPATTFVLNYGLPGDQPVVNNWIGTSIVDLIGVFRCPMTGVCSWIVDSVGDGVFRTTDPVYSFGLPGDIAVVGDWNDNHQRKRIGVFRSGLWILEINGTNAFALNDIQAFFGLPGDLPVVGKWTIP